MDARYVLAIDAGTGSCRAIVFDADGGEAALAQREWTHAPVPGVSGSAHFDTAGNWQLICDCVREALRRAGAEPGSIAAVSATSMREGMVLYDAAGRELWACPNVDGRAGAEAAELIASGAADRIYAVGGDWVSITAPPRLRWLARHEPELLERVAAIGMLSDWIVHRLTGRHITDPSVGSSSALFDLADRTWSPELSALCAVDPATLPPVLEPGTVAGEVTIPAADETGLAPGTPVVVGGADTQLALVGLGVAESGATTVIGGTFWQTTTLVDTPLIDPGRRLRTLCHAAPGRWMIEGIGFLSGLALRWFRDAFCAPEAEAARAAGRDPYAVLEDLAAQAPPGAAGVSGIFSNVMHAQRWVHAAPGFVGFDLTDPARSGKKECVRAIEESAAYVVRGHIEIIRELAASAVDDVVFTGGAAQGRLWPQILADVLGVTVHIPASCESTSLGAAVLAAQAVGLEGEMAAPGRVPVLARRVEPDRDTAAIYDGLYHGWRALYQAALELSEVGPVRPLWRAAGA